MRLLTALVLCAAAVGLSCARARADDYGPHSDVRAIRAAVSVLMAARVRSVGIDPAQLRVIDVVANGDEAVADWKAGNETGLLGLHRIYGSWWASAEINDTTIGDIVRWTNDAAGALFDCYGWRGLAQPERAVLPQALHVSTQTAALAAAHVAQVADTTALLDADRASHAGPFVGVDVAETCSPNARPDRYVSGSGGYRAELRYALAGGSRLGIVRFTGRAPTRAEFPGADPGSDSMYFFSLAFGGAANAHVTGATLDVWCPFVLDTHVRYTLTLAGANVAIGPIDGTLHDNTLHFDLPSFSAVPGTSMMGEIDGY